MNEYRTKMIEQYRSEGKYTVCMYQSEHEDEARAMAEAMADMTFVSDYGYDVRVEPINPEYYYGSRGATHFWKVYIHERVKDYSTTWQKIGDLVHDAGKGMRAGLAIAKARAEAEAMKPTKRVKRSRPECPRCYGIGCVTQRRVDGRQDGWYCDCGEIFGTKTDKALARVVAKESRLASKRVARKAS